MMVVREVWGVVRHIWLHPANRRQRLTRLALAIRFQLRGRVLRRRTLTQIGERSLLWAELHKCASSRAVYANPPDIEMRVWQRFLRPGDLFLDIGANVGIYSLIAAERGATVIAIEPDPEAGDRLRENALLNGYQIEVIECAVADRGGLARFTTGRDTVNRLDTHGAREVETRTVDDILAERHARGVKIDVEGFEGLVLAGARRALLANRIDLLQVECLGAEDALVPLTEAGYRFYTHDRDGGLIPVSHPARAGEVFARPGETFAT